MFIVRVNKSIRVHLFTPAINIVYKLIANTNLKYCVFHYMKNKAVNKLSKDNKNRK